jgi:hypothetical protein
MFDELELIYGICRRTPRRQPNMPRWQPNILEIIMLGNPSGEIILSTPQNTIHQLHEHVFRKVFLPMAKGQGPGPGRPMGLVHEPGPFGLSHWVRSTGPGPIGPGPCGLAHAARAIGPRPIGPTPIGPGSTICF